MKPLANFVSLHPYFKVHPGKLEAFTAAFPGFVAETLFPQSTRRGRIHRKPLTIDFRACFHAS